MYWSNPHQTYIYLEQNGACRMASQAIQAWGLDPLQRKLAVEGGGGLVYTQILGDNKHRHWEARITGFIQTGAWLMMKLKKMRQYAAVE